MAPNESEWDQIYVLPVYVKPGKHTYMIKFKNTQQPYQAQLIQQAEKTDPETQALVSKKLKPEIFVYGFTAVARTEPVPICKPLPQ